MSIAELESYFKGFTSHEDIQTAIFGSVDDLLDGLPLLKEADYPVLFVPFFTRLTDENDADYTWDNLSLMVALYKPWPKGTPHTMRNSILAELEPIMNEVIGKIYEDINEELFPIQSDMGLKGDGPNISEPLAPNRLIGWVYEFQFLQTSQIKHNPAKWQ